MNPPTIQEEESKSVSESPRWHPEERPCAFERIGYRIDLLTGSPVISRKDTPPHWRLTIPSHKQLAKGMLRGLIREAGITVNAFLNLL